MEVQEEKAKKSTKKTSTKKTPKKVKDVVVEEKEEKVEKVEKLEVVSKEIPEKEEKQDKIQTIYYSKKENIISRIINKIGIRNTVILVLVIVVLIFSVVLFGGKNTEDQIKIEAKSTLDHLSEKSDLETTKFKYSGIVKVCKSKKCSKNAEFDEYKYFVSYEGYITAGIDFKQIDVEVDKVNKKLILNMPDVEIQKVTLNTNSLDRIFVEDKWDKPEVLANDTKICNEDLEKRSESDETIKQIARENTKTVLAEFFIPWIEIYDKEYSIEIRYGE